MKYFKVSHQQRVVSAESEAASHHFHLYATHETRMDGNDKLNRDVVLLNPAMLHIHNTLICIQYRN